MPVLRTLVNSSRALVTGARDVARFREIATVFITHGFGWAFAQLKLRRELQVDFEGADLTRAALASPDTGKRLVAAFTQLGPTFVKLGQILSTRTDVLPRGITDELATLQDNVEGLAWDEIDAALVRELGGGYRERFSELEHTPLASASIAQVHRATLEDGTPIALKVQRPGVRPKIESDLGILHVMAGLLEEAIEEAQAMDLRGMILGFTKSISQELDFRIEARNLERFASLHAQNDRVVFPQVFDEFSTAEVLCMEFLSGRKFSEALESGEDTSALAEIYFDLAYRMLFIHGFFHGDLHPGNVIVMEGARVGVIDCGMVGRLSPSMKDKIIDIFYAILNEDLEALARTFYDLSIRIEPVDYDRFEADVIEIGERYLVGLPLSEVQVGTLFAEIVAGATRHKVRMPTDFTMMFKAILTTEGMAKAIAPDVDPIELARPFITQMVHERYNPERLKQMLLGDFSMLSRMFRSLPRSLPAVLDDLKAGKLAIAVSRDSLERQRAAADARMARAIRAGITISLFAGGTYALGLPLPHWGLLGIPIISAVFFTFAAFGVVSLLWR